MNARGSERVPLAALRALERFRGGQSAPSPAVTLLRRLEEMDTGGASRRREDLLRRAVDSEAMARRNAELVYDVALEEGLDPAFAFELVATGVAVCDGPPSDDEEAAEETIVEATPEWIAPAGVSEPVATEDVVRERRMRVSFRRLRGELERWPTAEDAIAAFAAAPDVGECGYLLS